MLVETDMELYKRISASNATGHSYLAIKGDTILVTEGKHKGKRFIVTGETYNHIVKGKMVACYWKIGKYIIDKRKSIVVEK